MKQVTKKHGFFNTETEEFYEDYEYAVFDALRGETKYVEVKDRAELMQKIDKIIEVELCISPIESNGSKH